MNNTRKGNILDKLAALKGHDDATDIRLWRTDGDQLRFIRCPHIAEGELKPALPGKEGPSPNSGD